MGSATDLRDAFPALAAEGLGVVDVGARGGIHHPVFEGVAPILDVVGFEPDAAECRRLNAAARTDGRYRSLRVLPCALGLGEGEQVLHVGRLPGTSSFYRPNQAFLSRFPDAARYDVVGTIPVTVRALDRLAADPSGALPPRLDFIKLDTQGSELDVLRGAEQALRSQIVAVEVEVEFAPLYEGQPVFRDVDAFLDGCGFSLFKLRRSEWVRRTCAGEPQLSAGQTVFGDALYVKDAGGGWSPRDAHQAESLILLAVLYDLHDFALELLQRAPVAGLVQAGRIEAYVRARAARLGRRWSRPEVLRDLLRLLRDPAHWLSPFKRYERRWARGDHNFYSRV